MILLIAVIGFGNMLHAQWYSVWVDSRMTYSNAQEFMDSVIVQCGGDSLIAYKNLPGSGNVIGVSSTGALYKTTGGSTTAADEHEIVVGTGSGVTSSDKFIYQPDSVFSVTMDSAGYGGYDTVRFMHEQTQLGIIDSVSTIWSGAGLRLRNHMYHEKMEWQVFLDGSTTNIFEPDANDWGVKMKMEYTDWLVELRRLHYWYGKTLTSNWYLYYDDDLSLERYHSNSWSYNYWKTYFTDTDKEYAYNTFLTSGDSTSIYSMDVLTPLYSKINIVPGSIRLFSNELEASNNFSDNVFEPNYNQMEVGDGTELSGLYMQGSGLSISSGEPGLSTSLLLDHTDAQFTVSGGVSINLGTTASAKLDVKSTSEQLRLRYDNSNYFKTQVSSDGAVGWDAVGTDAEFTLQDGLTINNSRAGSPALSIHAASGQSDKIFEVTNFGSNTTFLKVGYTGKIDLSRNGADGLSTVKMGNQSTLATGYNLELFNGVTTYTAFNHNGQFVLYNTKVPKVGYTLQGDGTKLKMKFNPTLMSYAEGWFFQTDFFGGAYSSGNMMLLFGSTGTGSTGQSGINAGWQGAADVSNTRTGIWFFTPGSTASGVVRLYSDDQNLDIDDGLMVMEIQLSLGDSATTSDKYYLNVGWSNNSGNENPNRQIQFRYNIDSVASHKWECVTTYGTVNSTTTSVSVTQDVYYVLRIEATATEVKFYIDGNLVATHTTQIPPSAMGFDITMGKKAGTTTKYILLDYLWAYQRFATPRTDYGYESIAGY